MREVASRGYYGSGGGRQTLTDAAYGHCEAFVVQFHSLCLPLFVACCKLLLLLLLLLQVTAAALRELSNLSQVEF